MPGSKSISLRAKVVVTLIAFALLACVAGCVFAARWVYLYGLPERAAFSAVPCYPGASFQSSEWYNQASAFLHFFRVYYTEDSLAQVQRFYEEETGAQFEPVDDNPNATISQLNLDTPMLKWWDTRLRESATTLDRVSWDTGPIEIRLVLEPDDSGIGTTITIWIRTTTYRG